MAFWISRASSKKGDTKQEEVADMSSSWGCCLIQDPLMSCFGGKENPTSEPTEIAVQPYTQSADIQLQDMTMPTGQAVVSDGDAKPPDKDEAHEKEIPSKAGGRVSEFGKKVLVHGKKVLRLATRKRMGQIKRQLRKIINQAIRPFLGVNAW